MYVFLLIYRKALKVYPSPEQLQNSIREWQNWYGTIAAQNKLVRPLQCWDAKGIVVSSHSIVGGPYAELEECIRGITFIQAVDYNEALEIAKGCPILKFGGNVEVRMETSDESAVHVAGR
jgi:hypothetical protein